MRFRSAIYEYKKEKLPLPKIVIKVDIDPEEATRLEDKNIFMCQKEIESSIY